MMEIDRFPRGTYMRQIMVALNDDEALRTMAIIRIDPDRRNPEFDKWCIIMLSKGRSHEPYREIGHIKEQAGRRNEGRGARSEEFGMIEEAEGGISR